MIKTSAAFLCFRVLVACLAFSLMSCEDDVGTPCRITNETATTPTETEGTLLNPQSLDCQSRLCVATPATENVQAQCTKICDSPSDCPDKTDNCPEGFKCVVGTVTGPFQYCKMCVCNTFTTGNEGREPPAGVTPNCPKL
jgi:hypothetical protein